MNPRYAIYFTPPPHSDWWQAGSQWLGRCAITHRVLKQPEVPGWSVDAFHQITSSPRRYGWHATLKAPFYLAYGVSEHDLCLEIDLLTRSQRPIKLNGLSIREYGDDKSAYLAFGVNTPHPHLSKFAQQYVETFHAYSAPLDENDLIRRRQQNLTPRQEELLLRWGYPYVFEQFKFHMTLSGNVLELLPQQKQYLISGATHYFAQLPTLSLDGLGLFCEPCEGEPFELVKYWALEKQ